MRKYSLFIVTVMTIMHLVVKGQSPCPNDETSCILRHLLSHGLIRNDKESTFQQEDYYQEARANEYIAESFLSDADHYKDVNNERSQKNSKFRSDCWDEEDAPTDGFGASAKFRVKRGNYRRGRGYRGQSEGTPCLWETSYYMGDS